MKFADIDRDMRIYETAHDHCVLPGLFMVVRLDGRSFTRLTKEVCDFEAPFDPRFRDLMLATLEHLMHNSGLRVIYGYTQSDEISLLIHPDDVGFGRKLRKINSVLAGEASAHFSLGLGQLASFDCRVSQLPAVKQVIDYFRWRAEDAHRNALGAHCYWMGRKQGLSGKAAAARIKSLDISGKNELLFAGGVNFNELPAWQRRGCGVYWSSYEKVGTDPRTGATRPVRRQRLERELDLPLKQAYADWLQSLVDQTLEVPTVPSNSAPSGSS